MCLRFALALRGRARRRPFPSPKPRKPFSSTPINSVVIRQAQGTPSWSKISRGSPGQYQLALQIMPPPGTISSGAEEILPSGWEPSEISHDGIFDPASRRIRWLFFDGNARVLSYQLRSISPNSQGTITGSAAFDGAEFVTGGDRQLDDQARIIATLLSGLVQLSFAGFETTRIWILEQSSDLKSWDSKGEVNPASALTLPPGSESQKFFRLREK